MRIRIGGCGALVVVLGLAGGAVAARAEVVNAAPLGFTVSNRVVVPVAPAAAWEGLVAIGRWWDGGHTWSGEAPNLSLDPRAGGCLCESWSKGQVQHMVVIYAEPGKLLRLSGVLGPLQSEALSGTLTWILAPVEGGGTTVDMVYVVGGHRAGGLEVLAPIVDGVLGAQLQRLGSLLTTGSAVPPVPGTGSGK